MNKILWFVKYGPDSSHMWEAKSFDKLKDASALFAGKLSRTSVVFAYLFSPPRSGGMG